MLPYKIDYGRIHGVIITYTDITEIHLANEATCASRKDLHDSLEKRQQKNRLLNALAMAEERERRTLAKYLHDDLGQLFALIALKAMAMKKQKMSASLRSALKNCSQIIAQANEKLREMAFQLNPPMFDQIEFLSALHWLADEMQRIYGLHVSIADDGTPKIMELGMSATVFRAVRELLTNVAKHAQTETAMIVLRRAQNQHFELTVSDTGRGFDQTQESAADCRQRLGLISICERLDILGAQLSVTSQPGHGTTATLTIPLATASQAGAAA